MKHIVVTRFNFTDFELFKKYYDMMVKMYVPSINSQINKNFEVCLIINNEHIPQIKFKLDVPIRYFNSIDELNEYCKKENINIQTRHDCDDWMSYDYIQTIQQKYDEFIGKHDNFIIHSQLYKIDSNNGNLYKMNWEYGEKTNSMFLSLCQKKVKNFVFDKKHSEMHSIVDKVITLGYDYTRLVIHGDNKLSNIKSSDRIIGNINPKDLSIIIPTFNNVEFIDECINSIKDSFEGYNYEILVGVDNCSKTYNYIIKKYDLHDYNIRFYFFEDNVGPYVVKNSLIKKTNSNKILFFDSDDILIKIHASLLIQNLDNFDMVRFKFYNFQNNLSNLEISPKYADGVFAIRKDVFLHLNGYEPWACGADSEIVWRVESNKHKIRLINECVFYRRRHSNNLTVKSDTNEKSAVRLRYRQILQQKKTQKTYGPLDKMVTSTNYKIYSNKEINHIPIRVKNIPHSRIVILSTLWNANTFLHQFVNSIKGQTYKDFVSYIVDDNSTDGSYGTLVKLTSGDNRFKIFRNSSQKYKTQNFYEIIHNHNLINDSDIIIELDGDDFFYNKNVIEKVYNHFKDQNLWIAGYKWVDNRGQKSPFKFPPNADNPRSQIWAYSAMRVFKAFLFRNIKQKDLMFEGQFVRAANDVAYGMPMLEMSGKEHFKSFNDVTYLYNLHDKNTHSKKSSVKDPGLQKRTEKYIYSLPRYSKLKFVGSIEYKDNPILIPKINNIENSEKINKVKDVVKIVKPIKPVIEVTPTVQKIVNIIPKIANNNNIKKIISKVITKTKEDNNTNLPITVENKTDNSNKIENLQNKEVKGNPKVRITSVIVKPQNKEEVNKKRQEFENILLYSPNGKKEVKSIPPKSIGVNI